MSSFISLTDPALAIIFATSPTGLGHIRVTDALYHGLPKNSSPVMFGSHAPTSSAVYRFISIHPLTRKIMELLQIPLIEEYAAYLERKILHLQSKSVYQKLKTILNERLVVPKIVLLVVSHAILGHQIGPIKEKLAREMGVKIFMVLQVTDDSPQTIWYVDDADLIFVPSEYTKAHLLSYAKKAKLLQVPIIVTAYPISPLLTEKLSDSAFTDRLEQVNPKSSTHINMTVPMPGAAVGTSFMSGYIRSMHQLSKRIVFHMVSKDAPYTQRFIKNMLRLPYVKLYVSTHDRTTIDNYERVFKEETVALELTKPSEQAFKTLATPRQRGGAILLFSKPVGRQEYDNLHFLRNHGLIPNGQDTRLLWKLASENKSIHTTNFLEKAKHWRSLLLPDNFQAAASFTSWCLKEHVFSTMTHYTKAIETEELKSNGVEQFWLHIVKLLKEKI